MAQPPKERLDSWKEIAAHLQRDERTAQRWEQENRLPVHRIPGKGRHAVFAYREEVDAWLAGTKPIESSPSASQAVTAAPLLRSLARTPRLVQAGVIVVLVIGLYAAVAFVWEATSSAPLASVTFRDNKFEARDTNGKVLWTYQLPRDTAEDIPVDRASAVNIVGDVSPGNKVAIVGLPTGGSTNEDTAVYSFSQTGQLLWRFQLVDKLEFGSGEYGPPWRIRTSLVLHGSGRAAIALAVNHRDWWPSVLTFLDSQGHPVGKFVNSGQTSVLASLDTPSGPRMLAGGVRNQESEVSGSLAVLDANNPSGSSPEEPGSGFECKSCPPGRPLKYLVFPRSEINIVTLSHFNQVDSIKPMPAGFEIKTDENESGPVGAAGIFYFSKDFVLTRAAWSDGYVELHRELEREGKIHHKWERCPDRFGPRLVRVWDAEHGWREIHTNPAMK